MVKRLPHLPLRPTYYDAIRAEIDRYFWETIYKPIAQAATEPNREITNAAEDALIDAIRAGVIQVQGNKFYGAFEAKTSKALRALGAKFYSRLKYWEIEPVLIPANILIAAAQAQSDMTSMRARVLMAIDQVNPNGVQLIPPLTSRYQDSVQKMERDFQISIKPVIGIPPMITKAMADMIAKDYATNLDLYIKKWVAEDILSLRQQVQKNTFAGLRAESMHNTIMQNYGVSKRKAQFLARQETSILMSKFRESRYKDVGCQRYVWRGAMDQRERHDHKILEGKVFSWSSPPVVDRKTGRRAHPGEDFGCRCIAVALVE